MSDEKGVFSTSKLAIMCVPACQGIHGNKGKNKHGWLGAGNNKNKINWGRKKNAS